MFKRAKSKPVSKIDQLGPENAECRLKTLDRFTIQKLLQVALDLDFNLSLVIRALESRKLDADKLSAWKNELFVQRVLLVQCAEWLRDGAPKKPFQPNLKHKTMKQVKFTCQKLDNFVISFNCIFDEAAKLPQDAHPDSYRGPNAPAQDKPPEYTTESMWLTCSKQVASRSVPLYHLRPSPDATAWTSHTYRSYGE